MNTATQNPPVFLIGMRRTGTSIMCRLMNKAEGIKLLFEPHDVWWAWTRGQLQRFQDSHVTRTALRQWRAHLSQHPIPGAKFALNPGIEAMEWRCFPKLYPDARFVFVRRNQKDTFASYYLEDHAEPRGAVPDVIHNWFHHSFYLDAEDFCPQHPTRAVLVEYEDVLKDADAALVPVWKLLGVDAPDIAGMIERPRHTEGMS
jgi:hypothetical protein